MIMTLALLDVGPASDVVVVIVLVVVVDEVVAVVAVVVVVAPASLILEIFLRFGQCAAIYWSYEQQNKLKAH